MTGICVCRNIDGKTTHDHIPYYKMYVLSIYILIRQLHCAKWIERTLKLSRVSNVIKNNHVTDYVYQS